MFDSVGYADHRTLPVHPQLREAFPHGLRTGVVCTTEGSVNAALALLAGPSGAGSWGAIIGLPDLGAEAAARWGVRLEHLVCIPAPGSRWMNIIAGLIEVMGVVVATPPARIAPAETRRLEARLRTRPCVLIIVGSWPRAAVQCRITSDQWSGLEQGHGLLTTRSSTWQITEKHVVRGAEVRCP